MKTIILPGFSVSNRQWAVDLQKEMHLKDEIIIHEWKHWDKGGSLSLYYELDQILGVIAKKRVNILAKSVGTRVAMATLTKIPTQINKLILCGIPSKDPSYSTLANFSHEKVIVFQNAKDPLGNFSEVKKFINSINPKIEVIKTPRNDHSYPYPTQFEKFLLQ